MRSKVRGILGAAGLAVLAVLGSIEATATSNPPVDPPALPAPAWSGRLSESRPEVGHPYDTEAILDRCTVCRLAATTTGRLPVNAFHIEGAATETGAALRLVSPDPEVREALWQATLARGQLMAALRNGADFELCMSCRARRDVLAALEISAKRIPQGVLLVYTSTSPTVVRQIHAVVQAGCDTPLQF